MTKHEEMQAIKARIMRHLDCTATEAAGYIASSLGRELATVHGWLSSDQARPIPDTALELLKLKLKEVLS